MTQHAPGRALNASLRAFGLLALVAPRLLASPPEVPKETCRMTIPWAQAALPESGLAWLTGEERSGPCPTVTGVFQRQPLGDGDLLVNADGPEGSGRYWTVTVGLAQRGQTQPQRGLCLTTSTVGWRTLRDFGGRPLPWIEDVDGDGRPELVLWASFQIEASESPAAAGLAAWAYDVDAVGLRLDLPATRKLAGDLAAAYAAELPDGNALTESLRRAASGQLRALAEGRCLPAAEDVEAQQP